MINMNDDAEYGDNELYGEHFFFLKPTVYWYVPTHSVELNQMDWLTRTHEGGPPIPVWWRRCAPLKKKTMS